MIRFPSFLGGGRRWRSRVWFGSTGLVLATGASLGWIGSEQLLKPTRRPLEPRHEAVLENPAEFGLRLGESYVVTTGDGIGLHCFLISPAESPGAAVKTRRMRERLGVAPRISATVVMLHGRSGIREDAFPVAERFVAAGFQCLVYDARAHGVSGGEFSTYGAREVDDLRVVLDDAETRFGRERLGPMVGFGISLGAAVLLQTLPEEPRLESAVVVAPFADLPSVLHRAVGNVVDPRMPTVLTRMVTTLGGWRGGFSPTAIRPAESARGIGVPVLVVHGELDRVIAPEDGRRVFAGLSSPASRFRLVKGGRHHDVLAVGGDDLYEEMIEFWLATLPGS